MKRMISSLLLACLLLIPLAAGAERTLYLGGCIDDRIQRSFMKENPDVVLKFDDEILNPDEIITRLLTGDTAADLYHTFVDSTFAALVRKGYAMDLSSSDILTDDVNRMYPNIRRAITNDAGNPVAYPWLLEVDTWKVNITWWRAVFGEEPLPDTYAEFFREKRFPVIWSSPMLRGRETAAALTGGAADVRVVGELHELCYGEWDGLSFDEIRARYRELISKYHPDKFAGLNDPEFSRLAAEKFQQVQGAYEELRRLRGM